jgi:2',3'-cyclic-nucleotide 2'-phosphodiesterase (5'-nucleotidase family)
MLCAVAYGATYYLSRSLRSMQKTDNFHFTTRLLQLLLPIGLLACFATGAAAQTGAAAPAKSTSSGSSSPMPTRSAVVSGSKTSQAVIDPSLPDDANVTKMLEPYSGKVRALEIVIGTLDGELKKTGLGGGTLGNFVTDGMRAQAAAKLGKHIDLALSNSGGLRKNAISPGELRITDIFELLPFENALVELDLTGEQLMKALQVSVEYREPQSGARILYRANADKKLEIVKAVLVGADGFEKPIDPAATYHVVTVDYLLSVANGKFAILQEAKVQKPLGVTIRDAMIDYVKGETTAGRHIKAKFDGRFRREGPSGPPEGNDPQ